MNVIEKTYTEKAFIKRDYQDGIVIEVQPGKGRPNITLAFYDGETEDNTLCRNFSDVFSIVLLLEMAHAAGAAGEKLTITQTNFED